MTKPGSPPQRRKTSAAARRRIDAKRAAERAAAARRQRRRRWALAASAVVVVLVAVGVTILVQNARTGVEASSATPANTAPGTDGAFAVGRADAPVTVDLYEDFQCPVCQQFEAATGDTLARLVSDGTVLARYHPIAILDRASPDQYSTRAANAAAVVADAAGPDAFLAFHTVLYDNQPAENTPGLTDDQLVAFAGDAGATGSAVENAIRDLRFGDWVKTVTDKSSQAGVTATPTVIVNGTPLQDRTAAGLSAAVAAAESAG